MLVPSLARAGSRRRLPRDDLPREGQARGGNLEASALAVSAPPGLRAHRRADGNPDRPQGADLRAEHCSRFGRGGGWCAGRVRAALALAESSDGVDREAARRGGSKRMSISRATLEAQATCPVIASLILSLD